VPMFNEVKSMRYILGFPMGILIGYVAFYVPYSMRLSYLAFV